MMITLEHNTDGRDIAPGQLVSMIVRPQACHLALRGLYISYRPDTRFSITSVRIGNREQIRPAGYYIPADVLEGFRVGGSARLERLACLAHLDPILVAMDFMLEVQNVGPVPSPFAAIWTCEQAGAGDPLRERLIGAWESIVSNKRPAYTPDVAPMDPEVAQRFAPSETAIVPFSSERIGNLGERVSGASELDRVPGRQGPIDRWTRTPHNFGWDPDGEG